MKKALLLGLVISSCSLVYTKEEGKNPANEQSWQAFLEYSVERTKKAIETKVAQSEFLSKRVIPALTTAATYSQERIKEIQESESYKAAQAYTAAQWQAFKDKEMAPYKAVDINHPDNYPSF